MTRKSAIRLLAISALLFVLTFIPLIVGLAQHPRSLLDLGASYLVGLIATLGALIIFAVMGNTVFWCRKVAFVAGVVSVAEAISILIMIFIPVVG